MSEPVPEFDRNIDRFRIHDTKGDSHAKDSQVIEMKDWMTYDYWYMYLINLRLCETTHMIYYSVVRIYFIDMIALLILSFHLCVCLSIFSFSLVRLLRRRSSISTSILAPASASYLHPRPLVVVAAAATAVAAIVDGIWKAILPNSFSLLKR